jgi:uncharacterized membrane protein YoaK (UPF0700 family)
MEIAAPFIFAVAGFTELYRRLVAKDWQTAGVIAVAALAGAVAGHFGVYEVPNVATGIIWGFAASGVITTLSHLGNRTVPTQDSEV